jgi:hypothetical protein
MTLLVLKEKGKRNCFCLFPFSFKFNSALKFSTLLPVHRTHDDVNTAENRHDIGNFHTPHDMRHDLQVVEISSTNLPTPREDIIIPNDENS